MFAAIIITLGVIAVEPFIMTKAIAPAELAGVVAEVVVWIGIVRNMPWRTDFIAGLLAVQIAMQDLYPFMHRPTPVAGDDMPELALPTSITALLHHRVQAAGGQGRELGQNLADERQIGIDLRTAVPCSKARQTSLCQHPGNRAAMHPQLPRDRADPPPLDVVITQNLRLDLWGYGHLYSLQSIAPR